MNELTKKERDFIISCFDIVKGQAIGMLDDKGYEHINKITIKMKGGKNGRRSN